MKFLIPKEIKSKPKLFGLGIKECLILLIGGFLILKVFGDMVHVKLTIPFYIVSGITLFWMILPSVNNRGKQNYHSIFLFFKRNRSVYHAIDTNKMINKMIRESSENNG